MKKLFSATLGTVFSLYLSSANAALSSVDWQTANDGLLTRDTVTGLEWLDLSFTAVGTDRNAALNNTIAKIQNRLQNPSDILYGFRYASIGEVQSLFIDAGLLITDSGYQAGVNATPKQTSDFISLLGATFLPGELNGSFRRDLFGFTATVCADLNDSHCPSNASNSDDFAVSGAGFDYLNRTYADLVIDHTDPNSYRFNTGHFLVRDHQSLAAVPTPAAGSLLLSSMLLLCRVRAKGAYKSKSR